jgi:thioredoxin-related protein
MLKKVTLLSFMLIFCSVVLVGQSAKPERAQNILDAALKNAVESNKSVFVIFHASWCSWCKRLDKVLSNEDMKKIFEDHFVVTHLDVMEKTPEKIEALENPGGNDIMKKMGGEKSGLPFSIFLDAKGNKLADSNVMPKNQNIGYPGTKEEIEAFIGLLKKGSTSITEKELTQVAEYLQKNAPKQN